MAANTHSLDLERASSQFAQITDANQTGLDITGDMTLEAWVKPESQPTDGSFYYFLVKRAGGGQNSFRTAYTSTSGTKELEFLVSSDGSNDTSVKVAATLSNGTWYHIAFVYDASAGECDFYVNGSQQGATQTGLPTSIFNSTAPFELGAQAGSNTWDGLIDEARAWSVERTASQIADNQEVDVTGQTGLQGYWKLNNGYTDETANGNDLTASGSPSFSTDVPFATYAGEAKAQVMWWN